MEAHSVPIARMSLRTPTAVSSGLSRSAWLASCLFFSCLLRLAVLVVLRDEGPEVVGLFLGLDAGECHLGAGDLGLRVLDVVEELILVPGDAGILVGVGIGIIRRGAGLAAVEPV